VEGEVEKLRSVPEYTAHLVYRIVRKDGRLRWVRDIGNCIRDDKGDPLFLQGAVYDVTEQKNAEEQALMQQQQLMEAAKMISLGNLVSGVAHEINNPNHIIMSHVYPLTEVWKQAEPVLARYHKEVGDLSLAGIPFEQAKKEIPEMFSAVLDGSTRIKTIVNELRDYARERPAEPPNPVQINQVVKSAITLLTNMLKRFTDRFSVDYEKRMPDVLGNYQRLEQVVIHLVRNACQALDNKEEAIKVSTAFDHKKRMVVLLVEDEGVGIEREAMEHITDPFYTTKRESGGSGLGLSTSTSIILEHRGTLSFTSVPGKGTVATVRIPAMDAAEGGAE
jgi:polar amino acid transport system substrate-binding protein